MKQLFAPNGLRIVGTEELVPGIAVVNGWEANGAPIYAGHTDLNWDGQRTVTDDNDLMMCIDENGTPHSFASCTLRDEVEAA
ncbi:hypothetical protein WK03_35755 [Burkholderia cepacia]|uniref:hypothetical protein n=1 Tax=Burkholderia cepacia TaxID=292 RepID=UPI0007596A2A|nr:hypothetical protein [Burkholderia cepacia]KVQ35823.1 hypothetical protein WK03_35755 [Burkholderia cepacia]